MRVRVSLRVRVRGRRRFERLRRLGQLLRGEKSEERGPKTLGREEVGRRLRVVESPSKWPKKRKGGQRPEPVSR